MSRNQPKPGFARLQGGHPLASGLVAAYVMANSGGPTLRDAAGALHGTLWGPAWGSDAHGSVLSFDGVNDYVALGTSDALNLVSEFSVALRVRCASLTGFQGLLTRRQTLSNFPLALGLSSGVVKLYSNVGSDVSVGMTGTVPLNTWLNVVVTRKGTQINWYLDGVADAANPATLALGAGAPATTTYIGCQDYGSGITQFFTGDIEYLYVYRRALAAHEAAALHDDPYAFVRPCRNVLRSMPVASAAVVQLSQAAEASMPDRPVSGGVGLKVAMQQGAGGRYLEHDLGSDQTLLHTRVMLNPASAAGGWVSILRGFSGAGAETFTVRLHGFSRAVRLTTKFGGDLNVTLASELAWHCLEVKADAAAGDAALWVNGRLSGAISGGMLSVPTRRLRIGGVLKQADVTGELFLDEWVMADGYVGPVRVEPLSPHADDPSRWLVVYNTAVSESVQWAQWYRDTRHVPYANLLGLALPTSEQATQAEFTAMQEAVQQYLTQNGLDQQVMGVLCGHGVPGWYVTGTGAIKAVASSLQVVAPGTLFQDNPVFALTARPMKPHLGATRMTARIDGATLAESQAITQQALAIEGQPLTAVDSVLYVDPYMNPELVAAPLISDMLSWATGVERQLLRLPVRLPDPALGVDADFTEISGDGFFWGWRTATPPPGFFGNPAGRRVFLSQLHCDTAIVASLRVNDGTWGRSAIEAGYASVAGACTNTTPSATPRVERFFAGLAAGWSLAEAWAACTPVVRANLMLVGDPFMRVNFPRAGWNVYGPFDSWHAVDCAAPIAALRDDETTALIPVSAQVSDGSHALYLLRRVDDAGREEHGTRHVRFQRVGSQLRSVPILPLSPLAGGWSPSRRTGDWHITAIWPRPLRELGIREVQLMGEPQGGAAATIAATSATAGPMRSVEWDIPVSPIPQRFAIRAVADDDGTSQTPWSQWVATETPVVRDVVLIEGGNDQ